MSDDKAMADIDEFEKEVREAFEKSFHEGVEITEKYRGHENDELRHRLQKECRNRFFEEYKKLRKKYNIPDSEDKE